MTEQGLAELDSAVAQVEGLWPVVEISGKKYTHPPLGYRPTRDPAEAMRLLEKHKLELRWCGDREVWICELPDGSADAGPTPAIAICKAVVALHRAKGMA